MRFEVSALAVAAFVGLSSAACPPGGATPGATTNVIHAPLSYIIPAGKPFDITWTPSSSAEQTVSIILLRGPSTNLVFHSNIATGIQNTGKFSWTPANSIEPDISRYGIEIFQDSNCAYQYSNQFGISNDAYSSSTTTAAAVATSATSSSEKSSEKSAATSAVTSAATSSAKSAAATSVATSAAASAKTTPSYLVPVSQIGDGQIQNPTGVYPAPNSTAVASVKRSTVSAAMPTMQTASAGTAPAASAGVTGALPPVIVQPNPTPSVPASLKTSVSTLLVGATSPAGTTGAAGASATASAPSASGTSSSSGTKNAINAAAAMGALMLGAFVAL